MPDKARERLILALDGPDKNALQRLVDKLREEVRFYKIGCWGFTAWGPEMVRYIRERGGEVFLDLKFHDIPHTVGGAVAEAARLGVYFITLHAQGGRKMLCQSVEQLDATCRKEGLRRPRLLAITLLTSLGKSALAQELKVSLPLHEQVLHLARMAREEGVDGAVASPREVSILREDLGKNFLLVTPGVRPVQMSGDDQQRVLTPEEALRRGSDYLVIGRPITGSPRPVEAAREILRRMEGVL